MQGLQGSDNPEFWEALADQVLKAHPDRGRLLGHLMAEAVDEDVVAANAYLTEKKQWEKEGVPLETISEMLGHKSTKTTREYLGITVEDMEEAHMGRYNRSIRIREELRAKTLNRPNQASERETG